MLLISESFGQSYPEVREERKDSLISGKITCLKSGIKALSSALVLNKPHRFCKRNLDIRKYDFCENDEVCINNTPKVEAQQGVSVPNIRNSYLWATW